VEKGYESSDISRTCKYMKYNWYSCNSLCRW